MIKKLFIIFILFFPLSIDAQNALIDFLQSIHSMQANFAETVSDQNGIILQKNNGSMALQRPAQVLWQVKEPNAETIIVNHKKIWIYDEDLEQVTIQFLNEKNNAPLLFLLTQNNANFAKAFTIQTIKNGSNTLFILLPKNKDNLFLKIKLGFTKRLLTSMLLFDHFGHETHIYFNQIKINNHLSPTLFILHAPNNVDIIDETKK